MTGRSIFPFWNIYANSNTGIKGSLLIYDHDLIKVTSQKTYVRKWKMEKQVGSELLHHCAEFTKSWVYTHARGLISNWNCWVDFFKSCRRVLKKNAKNWLQLFWSPSRIPLLSSSWQTLVHFVWVEVSSQFENRFDKKMEQNPVILLKKGCFKISSIQPFARTML